MPPSRAPLFSPSTSRSPTNQFRFRRCGGVRRSAQDGFETARGIASPADPVDATAPPVGRTADIHLHDSFVWRPDRACPDHPGIGFDQTMVSGLAFRATRRRIARYPRLVPETLHNVRETSVIGKLGYRDTGLAPRQLLSVHSSDREPTASESPMTERSKSVNSNQRWKRITQLSIIAVPFVMVAIYYFSPPEKGSEGNPPTGVLARPPDPIASTITIPKPETEPTEPVESAQTEIQTVRFEIETRERTVERHFQNGHCENSTNIKWEVRAAEGWRIDVTSLKLAPDSISSKSSYFGVSDLTEDGFTMNGRVSNNGDCVKVLGKVVARDGRGHLTVAGTYNEKRDVEVPNEG